MRLGKEHSRGLHASEPQMVAAGPDFAFAARADHVTSTIQVRAEKRPASMYTPWFIRLTRVKAGNRALRVTRHTPLYRQRRVSVGAVPIAAPLPHVAGHIVEAVTIRRILRDGCKALKTVFALVAILHGEIALINVRLPLAAGLQLVAPRIRFAGKAATRGEFPFRFRGQGFACPL